MVGVGEGGVGTQRIERVVEKSWGKGLGLLFFQEGEDIVWVVEVFLLGL